MGAEVKPKKKCGFNVIDPKRRSEIAKQGNQKLRELGKIHKWDVASGQAAGRVGGKVTQERRREVAEVRKVLAEIEAEKEQVKA